ncbi:hypothetical protein VTN49DRAFT_6091 [Thermomyces lanuginosus]|uniref:uncharacterized protein n=1 Tax=Thermomyces lanuginosus TaxID=5541 RepID=UPI0037445191
MSFGVRGECRALPRGSSDLTVGQVTSHNRSNSSGAATQDESGHAPTGVGDAQQPPESNGLPSHSSAFVTRFYAFGGNDGTCVLNKSGKNTTAVSEKLAHTDTWKGHPRKTGLNLTNHPATDRTTTTVHPPPTTGTQTRCSNKS